MHSKHRELNIITYARAELYRFGLDPETAQLSYGRSLLTGEYLKITVNSFGRSFTEKVSAFESVIFEEKITTACRSFALDIDRAYNLGRNT
jgi:hypothetical protein